MYEDFEREDFAAYYEEQRRYELQLAEEEYLRSKHDRAKRLRQMQDAEEEEAYYDWYADIATDDYYTDLPF